MNLHPLASINITMNALPGAAPARHPDPDPDSSDNDPDGDDASPRLGRTPLQGRGSVAPLNAASHFRSVETAMLTEGPSSPSRSPYHPRVTVHPTTTTTAMGTLAAGSGSGSGITRAREQVQHAQRNILRPSPSQADEGAAEGRGPPGGAMNSNSIVYREGGGAGAVLGAGSMSLALQGPGQGQGPGRSPQRVHSAGMQGRTQGSSRDPAAAR